MSKQIDWIATNMAREQSRSGFLRQATKITLGAAALLGGGFAGLAVPEVASAAGCCGSTTCTGGQCPPNTNVSSSYLCCTGGCGTYEQTCYSCYNCTQVTPPMNCTLLCQYSVSSRNPCPCVHSA